MNTWIVKRVGTNRNIGTIKGDNHDKVVDTAVRLFGRGIYLVLKEHTNPNTFFPNNIDNHYVCKHYDDKPNAFVPNIVRPFPEEDEMCGGNIVYSF